MKKSLKQNISDFSMKGKYLAHTEKFKMLEIKISLRIYQKLDIKVNSRLGFLKNQTLILRLNTWFKRRVYVRKLSILLLSLTNVLNFFIHSLIRLKIIPCVNLLGLILGLSQGPFKNLASPHYLYRNDSSKYCFITSVVALKKKV